MKLRNILLLILSLLVPIYLFVGIFNNNPGGGLDPGWQVALHLALKNNLIFGKDFIFTYGPLGIFYTRLSIGVSPYVYVLFDTFIILNTAFVLYIIFTKSNLGLALRIVFTIAFLSYMDVTIHLMGLLVFMLFEYIESKRTWLLFNIVILASVAFFIKLSTGLVPFIFILIFLWYCIYSGILTWKKSLMIYAGYLAVIFVSAYFLHTDVFLYVYNGFSIIDGYSESMHMARLYNYQISDLVKGIVCVFALLVPFLIYIRKIYADKRTLVLYIMIFACTFIVFKVAFTRIHDGQFFGFVVSLAGLLLFFTGVEKTKILYFTVLPIILLSILHFTSDNSMTTRMQNILGFSPYKRIEFYIASVRNYPGDNPQYMGDTQNYVMPPPLLNLIGNETVDIMPWDISFLSNNHLNYHPRPVPQSYSAYTKRLDQINADYIAEKGPKFLLVNPISIDNRYPFFDETKTKLEILSHYKVSAYIWHHVLLERLDKPFPYTSKKAFEGRFKFNDTIPLKISKEVQVAYPEIKYSILGKLYKFLFWAPELWVNFITQDGASHGYKSAKSVVNGGVIINKFLPRDDIEGTMQFVEHFGKFNPNIRAISFFSDMPWAFANDFNFTIERITYEGNKSELNPVYHPYRLTKIKEREEKLTLNGSLDRIITDNIRIDIDGWSFLVDSTKKHLTPSLLLENEGDYFIFSSGKKIFRPDVKGLYKDAHDSTGFHVVVFRDLLEKKLYNVGIVFMDSTNVVRKRMLQNIYVDNTRVGNGSVNTGADGVFQLRKYTLRSNDHEGKLMYNLEKVQTSQDYLKVAGWAAFENKSKPDLDSVKILLQGPDSTFYIAKTVSGNRIDVAGHYKNESLTNSGFDAVLMTTGLEKGNYALMIYVQDHVTKRGSYQFVKNVNVGFADYTVPVLFDGSFEEEEIELGLDVFKNSVDFLKIAGWAALKDSDVEGSVISILLKSETGTVYIAPTQTVLRKDVTQYFKNKHNFDSSGFEAIIAKNKMEPGIYTVGIYISNVKMKKQVVAFIDHEIEVKYTFEIE